MPLRPLDLRSSRRWLAKFIYHFHLYSFKFFSKPNKRILVIGDSHAAFLINTKLTPIASKGNYVSLWLGPRLLFNVADSEFEFSQEILTLSAKSKFRQVLFIMGEIDIRCHLASTSSNWDYSEKWIYNYLNWVKEVSSKLECNSITLLCGPPPTDYGLHNPNYPKVGTLNERISAFNKLNRLLMDTAHLFEGVVLKNPWPVVQDFDGSLSHRFTDDGCHINKSGAKLIRKNLEI